jgi:hypothetical protein
MKETYLGDGLYVSVADGYVWLRAPREGGDHTVGLDHKTLDAFLSYLQELRTTLKATGAQQ